MARRNHAAEIETWDKSLRNVICQNIAAEPEGTFVTTTNAAPTYSGDQLSQLGDRDISSSIGSEAGVRTSWAPIVALDVANRLKTGTPIVVANELMRHYESGFAEHGLIRIALTPGTCDSDASEPSSVWISERSDFGAFVSVQVRVRSESATADVRIRHIARPSERLL